MKHYQSFIDTLKADANSANGNLSAKIELYQEVLTGFEQLMKSFLIDYLPVRYAPPKDKEEEYCRSEPKKISNEQMIKNELAASDFLNQFEDSVNEYNSTYSRKVNSDISEELIIGKINMLAWKYYEELFNSCTPEEQYILFDIAHDMIINPKNESAIFSLLNKGLLVKKCYKINLMNMSFRRFILSKISREAKQELEKAIVKESGTWQGYRTTLIIIIIALFAFIGMANQDFMENLNQLFVVLGGGIALISGILGLLSRKSKIRT